MHMVRLVEADDEFVMMMMTMMMMMKDRENEVKKSVSAIVKWLRTPLEPWSTDNLEVRTIQFQCSLNFHGIRTNA